MGDVRKMGDLIGVGTGPLAAELPPFTERAIAETVARRKVTEVRQRRERMALYGVGAWLLVRAGKEEEDTGAESYWYYDVHALTASVSCDIIGTLRQTGVLQGIDCVWVTPLVCEELAFEVHIPTHDGDKRLAFQSGSLRSEFESRLVAYFGEGYSASGRVVEVLV